MGLVIRPGRKGRRSGVLGRAIESADYRFNPRLISPSTLKLWVRSDLGLSVNDAAITNPNAFDNAAWTKSACSVSPNVTTDPFGGNQADSLIEDSSTGVHILAQSPTSFVGGVPLTVSIYAKAGARNWIFLGSPDSGTGTFVNIATGVFGTSNGTVNFKKITPVGNGWFLITVNVTNASGQFVVYLATGDTVASYTGDGVSNVFLYGASVAQPKISGWADQSGNGNNLVQATATAQPLLVPVGQNSKPTLQFISANSNRLQKANVDIFSTGPYTFYMAFKVRNIVASAYYFCNEIAARTTGVAPQNLGAARTMNHNAVVNHDLGTDDTNLNIWSVRQVSAAAMDGQINGIDVGITNSGTATLVAPGGSGVLSVGAAGNGVNPSDIDVYEIVVYGSALNANDRNRINNYMRKRYGTA